MLVVAIVGPTASGKSALAVEVALRCNGEIVNTDSMQAYVDMDIGTAKPPEAEWRGVPHHVFSEWPPDHELSVAEFQAAARSAIEAVVGRGAVPIAVGGSGLYVSAVLDDLRFPGTDPAIRGALEAQLDLVGPGAMHGRLAAVDPAAAAAILPSNGRRIVRALEVIEITGEPFIATLPPPVGIYPTIRIGLEIPRDVLDARIEARVTQMWADGLVTEVEGLVERGLAAGRTAARALGYSQVLDYLAGTLTADEARQATVDATRKFARRQQRWFRRDARITWIPYDSPDAVERALALVEAGTST